MLKTRVMPCLLLRDRGLVKTISFATPSYVGDPINTVRIFNEKEVDELIFLDITATVEKKRPNFKLVGEIASECFMPFAYGGGIRTIEDIRTLFGLGAEKVVLNTYAHENPAFVREAATMFGSQSIVVSIDVRRWRLGGFGVYTHGGRNGTGLDPVVDAQQMERQGAGEILLTSIDRDGTFQGYDIELIRRVTAAVGIPVVACGGAGRIEHFVEAVKQGGASAVAAGSMVVYLGPNRAVLTNFPRKAALKRALADAAGSPGHAQTGNG